MLFHRWNHHYSVAAFDITTTKSISRKAVKASIEHDHNHHALTLRHACKSSLCHSNQSSSILLFILFVDSTIQFQFDSQSPQLPRLGIFYEQHSRSGERFANLFSWPQRERLPWFRQVPWPRQRLYFGATSLFLLLHLCLVLEKI